MKGKVMNRKFDEFTMGLAQTVTGRATLKQFGLGLVAMALVLADHSVVAGDILRQQVRSGLGQNLEQVASDPCGGRSLAIKGAFVTAIQVLPPFPSFPPDPFQPILRLLITAS